MFLKFARYRVLYSGRRYVDCIRYCIQFGLVQVNHYQCAAIHPTPIMPERTAERIDLLL